MRNDHAGRPASGQRAANGTIDDEEQLLRCRHRLEIETTDILVQRADVDLLLIRAPQGASVLLADERDHRLLVELGVVETVQEVDGTGSMRGDATADPARELGVPARHE